MHESPNWANLIFNKQNGDEKILLANSSWQFQLSRKDLVLYQFRILNSNQRLAYIITSLYQHFYWVRILHSFFYLEVQSAHLYQLEITIKR